MTVIAQRYRVWCPYFGQTETMADVIRAVDPADAAETFAEQFDGRGDYEFMRSEYDVYVLADDSSVPVVFTVAGESLPNYSARPKVTP